MREEISKQDLHVYRKLDGPCPLKIMHTNIFLMLCSYDDWCIDLWVWMKVAIVVSLECLVMLE